MADLSVTITDHNGNPIVVDTDDDDGHRQKVVTAAQAAELVDG